VPAVAAPVFGGFSVRIGRKVIVPSSMGGWAAGGVPAGPSVGLRKMNVPPESTSPWSVGGIVAEPSGWDDRPSDRGGEPAAARGSVPQAVPSAAQPEAPGRGSSSKKCGPVSSTAGLAGREPGGGASGSPSDGAGRLVPGTHAAPFQ
jgi:hypothetical protein